MPPIDAHIAWISSHCLDFPHIAWASLKITVISFIMDCILFHRRIMKAFGNREPEETLHEYLKSYLKPTILTLFFQLKNFIAL